MSESFLKIQTEIVGTSVAEYLGSVCEILTLILSKRMFSIISVIEIYLTYGPLLIHINLICQGRSTLVLFQRTFYSPAWALGMWPEYSYSTSPNTS